MIRRLTQPLLLLLWLSIAASACTSSETAAPAAGDGVAAPTTATSVEAEPTSTKPTPTEPTPTTPPTPLPEFGAYLVAKPNAGVAWEQTNLRPPGAPTRVIPVYDEPDGEPRQLLEVNAIDGVALPLPLYGWDVEASPTVLRVIEGAPGDRWFRVQAPTRPHNTTVWVSADDWEWASTTRRIEIDLANSGKLTVFDGDEVLMTSAIVQGRDSRPTPTHVTFLESGLLGTHFRGPAYGHAVLMMASFSEALGTFGGGGSPQNFLHGTNQPGLMGQRVSSGEVRIPDGALAELITLVHPGTPILLFDADRNEILEAELRPAETTVFSANAVGGDAAMRIHPQLWVRCDEPRLVCLNPTPAQRRDRFFYATARDLDSDDEIPVFNAVWGVRQTLLDMNTIDGTQTPYPLYALTPFGAPTVLRVIQTSPDGHWLNVQVPVRPNGSTAWVRAEDFVVDSTTVRVDVTTAAGSGGGAGALRVFDGSELLLEVPIASGRESRPTAHVTGWISQVIEGPALSPDYYGPWVVDVSQSSEALGTFGGGGQPRMALRGTNQPDTIGQRVTSGSPRLTNEAIEQLVGIEGLLGAPVTVSDRPFGPANESEPMFEPTRPARMTGWSPDAPAVLPRFS